MWANSSYLMLPPKRSLRSWIILSNGEASKLEEEDEEKEEDIFFYDKLDNRSETTIPSTVQRSAKRLFLGCVIHLWAQAQGGESRNLGNPF